MASIIASVDNFANDKKLIIKVAFLLLPMLLVWFMGEGLNDMPYLAFGIFYYYIGYMIVTFHNALKFQDVYYPNPVMSLFDIVFRGFLGLLCITPITIGAFYAILFFENMNTIVQIKYFAIIFALLIWAAIVFVQLTLYSKEYNPLDAFKFKTISDVGGEFMTGILKMMVQIGFLIGFPTFLVYLAGNTAFSDNPEAFVIFKQSLFAFSSLLAYLTSIDFLIQLYEELIISKDDEDYMHI